jgi:hypothetical protein
MVTLLTDLADYPPAPKAKNNRNLEDKFVSVEFGATDWKKK